MRGKRGRVAAATRDDSQLQTKPSAHGHQPKGAGSPAEAVLVGRCAALPGFAEILRARPPT